VKQKKKFPVRGETAKRKRKMSKVKNHATLGRGGEVGYGVCAGGNQRRCMSKKGEKSSSKDRRTKKKLRRRRRTYRVGGKRHVRDRKRQGKKKLSKKNREVAKAPEKKMGGEKLRAGAVQSETKKEKTQRKEPHCWKRKNNQNGRGERAETAQDTTQRSRKRGRKGRL